MFYILIIKYNIIKSCIFFPSWLSILLVVEVTGIYTKDRFYFSEAHNVCVKVFQEDVVIHFRRFRYLMDGRADTAIVPCSIFNGIFLILHQLYLMILGQAVIQIQWDVGQRFLHHTTLTPPSIKTCVKHGLLQGFPKLGFTSHWLQSLWYVNTVIWSRKTDRSDLNTLLDVKLNHVT